MSEQTPVVHCKKDEYDVYIGRGNDKTAMHDNPIGTKGWLGNPYTLLHHDRDESIRMFTEDFLQRIRHDADFADAVASISGETLGCWCSPKPCHGEVIAQVADLLQEMQTDE
jgi:hypothetical protein